MSLEGNTGLQIYSNCCINGANPRIKIALGPAVDAQIYNKSSCKSLFDLFALAT